MGKLILSLIAAVIFFGCDTEKKEKAEAIGRLSLYLYKIENGQLNKKLKQIYPDLQIGLIYYDPLDDTYKAVDPRKGFEKLGYYETFNREVYHFVMYKIAKKAVKDEKELVEKELLKTLKYYQDYLKEASITQKKERETLNILEKYGAVGIIIFSLIVGSSIGYLLLTIARKHIG